MPAPFVRRGDEVRFRLHEAERALLTSLLEQLDGALAEGDPSDAVIGRLAPRAVLGDADADAELRATLAPALRDERREAIAAVLARLGAASGRGRVEVRLRDDEPWMLLGVLNDVRLAVGVRVGIEDLDRARVPEDDPRARMLAIVDHLGWWQWQLIALLEPDAAAAAEPRDDDPEPGAIDPWSGLGGPGAGGG